MPAAADPMADPAERPFATDLPLAWAGDGGAVPQLIAVRACGVGWRVRGEPLEDILFTSGAAAERAARRLARAIATRGVDAKVNVYDARDHLVGAIQYFAAPRPPSPDVLRQCPWSD